MDHHLRNDSIVDGDWNRIVDGAGMSRMPNTVLLYPRVTHVCKDDAPGLFTDQIVMYPPEWMGLSRKTIAVDRCMGPVIEALWDAGVVTRACCCGHGRYAPSVYVEIGTVSKTEARLVDVSPELKCLVRTQRYIERRIKELWGEPAIQLELPRILALLKDERVDRLEQESRAYLRGRNDQGRYPLR